jgi:hypothetical protein
MLGQTWFSWIYSAIHGWCHRHQENSRTRSFGKKVAITAVGKTGLEKECLEADGWKSISKHFKIKELVRVINSVEDMLDTSRLESKEFKIQRTRMRIEEIARSAAEELTCLRNSRRITQSLKIDGELSYIEGIGRRLYPERSHRSQRDALQQD